MGIAPELGFYCTLAILFLFRASRTSRRYTTIEDIHFLGCSP